MSAPSSGGARSRIAFTQSMIELKCSSRRETTSSVGISRSTGSPVTMSLPNTSAPVPASSSSSQGLFNALRCFAADQQAVFLADRAADSFVELQTARLDQTAGVMMPPRGRMETSSGIIANVHYQDAPEFFTSISRPRPSATAFSTTMILRAFTFGVLNQIVKGALLHPP